MTYRVRSSQMQFAGYKGGRSRIERHEIADEPSNERPRCLFRGPCSLDMASSQHGQSAAGNCLKLRDTLVHADRCLMSTWKQLTVCAQETFIVS
jgi:hypothetical protein